MAPFLEEGFFPSFKFERGYLTEQVRHSFLAALLGFSKT